MKMDYFVAGTNNMQRAVEFYDALFALAGIGQIGASDRMTFWGGEPFAFAVALPFDGNDATPGNGNMFGFGLKNQDEVQKFYEKVLELGGTSEGTPSQKGPRYSGYVRDLDGNKICFYC